MSESKLLLAKNGPLGWIIFNCQDYQEGVKAFSETDFNADLNKIDVPTLIVHGDDDQFVPIAATAMLTAQIVKRSTLKVYRGAPHGLTVTHKNQLNIDLQSFIEG